MTILRRATDILTANLHEWLDRCEDPERMLRQLIRELEEATDFALDATAKAIAHERLLERQLSAGREPLDRLQERARAAVARGDEAAAKAHVAARLRQQQFVDACESQFVVAASESARFRRELDVLRSQLSEARQTMHLYVARQRIVTARQSLTRRTQAGSSPRATWGRFDRLYERIDRADAESAALLELLAVTNADVERQFDEQVEEAFASLKTSAADT